MKCDEVRNELSAHLDGEVAPEVRGAIEAHVAGCESCRQRLEQLQQLTAGVAALPRLSPSPQFLTEVRRKLAEGEPVAGVSWVDRLFRPVWLKVPVEALAVIVVAATILWVQRPPARQEMAAARTEPAAREGTAARILESAAGAGERADTPAAAAPARAEDRAVVKEEAELVARAPAKTAAEPPLEAKTERLPTAEMELAKDAAYPLPVPPRVAPAAPPQPGAEADKLSAAEVAGVLTNQVVLGPIVVVHAGDWTKMRRQVEATAARLGGVVIARPESQLASRGRLVHTVRVRLPADQVGNFASQLEPISIQPRDNRQYQLAGEARGTPSAVASSAASGAVLYRALPAVADEKRVPVEVEVQIVPK